MRLWIKLTFFNFTFISYISWRKLSYISFTENEENFFLTDVAWNNKLPSTYKAGVGRVNVVLTCSVCASATVADSSYRWKFQGSYTLPPGVREKQNNLIISKVAFNHFGNYSCFVSLNTSKAITVQEMQLSLHEGWYLLDIIYVAIIAPTHLVVLILLTLFS